MSIGRHASVAIPVSESSQVGEARRTVANFAKAAQLNETDAGRAGIIVSELAQNLVKHATRGEIVLRLLFNGRSHGLEILSIDKGPGFDVLRCLHDGYSTSGTAGTGLGSVRRLATVFDVFSHANGSVILAQLWPRRIARESLLQIGAVCLPMKGEQLCGDNWSFNMSDQKAKFLVIDGLGHGPGAHAAAVAGTEAFDKAATTSSDEIVGAIHNALKGTRGAALALTEFNLERPMIGFTGVGNIVGVVIDSDAKRHFVSQPGTAGVEIYRVQGFQYPLSKDSVTIVHSDGLSARFQFDSYPGLLSRHAGVIAGVLYRDFARERDDITVLVVKHI